MLSRSHRLILRALPDFFINSQRLHSSLMTIFYRLSETANSTTAQAAIIVPKKVAASSVDRHRVKRQVMAVIEPLMSELPPGLQIVISLKSKSEPAELTAQVQLQIKRLKSKITLNA